MKPPAHNPSNVLFLADVEDANYLDLSANSSQWNITSEVLDFNVLHSSIERIGSLADENDVDFLLYSQNDQVGKRVGIGAIHQQLRLGYSSISAIDRGEDDIRHAQMRTCYDDFLSCNRAFPFEDPKGPIRRSRAKGSGTFSLVFDTEQLGGIRYGLPRVLSLLARRQIRATFFVTNIVNRVYSDLFSTLEAFGHELAPHGLCHEHLAPMSVDRQVAQLQEMIDSFGNHPSGANFIFRMNQDTIEALIRHGIRYFVYFDTNYHRLISYPKRSTRPNLIEHDSGRIWAIPVPVQTYGLPWFSIKNMLDSAIMQSRRCGFEHVSVLMHPFRDGSLENIETTERIIGRLLSNGLEPITLADLASSLERMDSFVPEPCDPRQMIETHRPKVSLPRTRWDFIGLMPETAMAIMRRMKKGPLF